MIHSATDELLEHLWYAAEEQRQVRGPADLRLSDLDGTIERSDLDAAAAGLKAAGLIQNGDGWRLSTAGEKAAAGIVRRHRLSEVLFVHAFGAPLREAEISACEMEHILSAAVVDRVCAFLGHPPSCPHGKRIPSGDCCRVYSTTVESLITRLIDLPVGSSGSIAYIAQGNAPRIARLAAFGVTPGSEIQLIARRPSCVLASGSTSVAVDDDIARDIYVTRR